jgi:arylsulfatase A-like enzyme
MTRREFLRFGIAGGAALIASPLLSAQSGPGRRGRPNIIVFLLDDYDKYETSVYGGKVLTPNLDRLAREGVTFHNAHVTSTVCTPSRYTFLTGRYASSSYFNGFLKLFPLGRQTLPGFNVGLEDDNMNIGAVLAKQGYATGFVGKYHVGPDIGDEAVRAKNGLHDVPKNVPFTDEINRKMCANEKRFRTMIKQRGFTWAKNIYWSNTKAPFQMHNPEWTIKAAVEFIELHKDRPFYLHYATTLLHGPNGSWRKSLDHPKVTGEGMIDRKLTAMPPRRTVMERINKAGLTESEAGYLWMDDSLGVLLDKLDKLGIAENTIVLFIADHGSDNKGSLYKKRGTEVPCLMRWPAGMAKGVRCDALIQNTDFVPTWFELAGVKRPVKYKIDGVSLAPLFKSPDRSVRDYVYCEMGAARSVKTRDHSYIALRYTKEQLEALRMNDRRTIKAAIGLSGGVARSAAGHDNAFVGDQLYDIRKDPDAKENLAGKPRHAAVLARMQKALTTELKRIPNRPFGEFVPGGNAVSGGDYDDVLAALRKAAGEKKKTKKKR